MVKAVGGKVSRLVGTPLWEGLAAYQVVGGVMAYQAEDGYPV